MGLKFCPVFSGSSGNCIFVSTDNTKILIDAGLSGIKIEGGLSSINTSCHEIDAILITHEHSDHVQGAGVLSRRYNIPLYATPGTWEAMEKYNLLGKINPRNKQYIYPEEKTSLNDICIKAFSIPHDAAEPVGYSIFTDTYKISIATDMGHITDSVRENIEDSHLLLLESNHDEEMLQNGRYPQQLKRRILSNFGHLSNVAAGMFLSNITNKNLKYVYLGHLSEENNRPVLAFETVKRILAANNIPVGEEGQLQLYMADRYRASKLLSLA